MQNGITGDLPLQSGKFADFQQRHNGALSPGVISFISFIACSFSPFNGPTTSIPTLADEGDREVVLCVLHSDDPWKRLIVESGSGMLTKAMLKIIDAGAIVFPADY